MEIEQQEKPQIQIKGFKEESRTTDAIRGILHNYAAGPNIFIELLQNADDAKARTIKFFLVRKNFQLSEDQLSSSKVFSPSINTVLKDALYVYDDGEFTHKNQQDIGRISSEGKKEDVSKNGKFGVGFRSVYHMTDVPCWISQFGVCYSDPLGKFVNPDSQESKFGLEMDLQNMNQIPDHFSHFTILKDYSFKSTQKDQIQGKLFRFGFRDQKFVQNYLENKQDQDYKLLKEDVITSDEVKQWMLDFIQNSSQQCLLFLKNVLNLEFYELEEGNDKPTLLYSQKIKPDFEFYSKLIQDEHMKQQKPAKKSQKNAQKIEKIDESQMENLVWDRFLKTKKSGLDTMQQLFEKRDKEEDYKKMFDKPHQYCLRFSSQIYKNITLEVEPEQIQEKQQENQENQQENQEIEQENKEKQQENQQENQEKQEIEQENKEKQEENQEIEQENKEKQEENQEKQQENQEIDQEKQEIEQENQEENQEKQQENQEIDQEKQEENEGNQENSQMEVENNNDNDIDDNKNIEQETKEQNEINKENKIEIEQEKQQQQQEQNTEIQEETNPENQNQEQIEENHPEQQQETTSQTPKKEQQTSENTPQKKQFQSIEEDLKIEWLTIQQIGSKKLYQHFKTQRTQQYDYRPIGGVALNLSEKMTKGQAFCMLPLPQFTNLPFHINGAFILPQNRTHIIHETHTASSSSSNRDVKWNQTLLEDLIYSCILKGIELLSLEKFQLQPNQQNSLQILDFLPILDQLNLKDFLKNFCENLIINAYKLNIFPYINTQLNKIQKIPGQNSIFFDFHHSQNQHFNPFHPHQQQQEQDRNEQFLQFLDDIFSKNGLKLCFQVPEIHLLQFKKLHQKLQKNDQINLPVQHPYVLTPELLSCYLSVLETPQKQLQILQKNHSLLTTLLGYLSPSFFSASTSMKISLQNPENLNKLPVFLTQSNTLTTLSKTPLIIPQTTKDTKNTLFQNCQDQFLQPLENCPFYASLKEIQSNPALKCPQLQLKSFDKDAFIQLSKVQFEKNYQQFQTPFDDELYQITKQDQQQEEEFWLNSNEKLVQFYQTMQEITNNNKEDILYILNQLKQYPIVPLKKLENLLKNQENQQENELEKEDKGCQEEEEGFEYFTTLSYLFDSGDIFINFESDVSVPEKILAFFESVVQKQNEQEDEEGQKILFLFDLNLSCLQPFSSIFSSYLESNQYTENNVFQKKFIEFLRNIYLEDEELAQQEENQEEIEEEDIEEEQQEEQEKEQKEQEKEKQPKKRQNKKKQQEKQQENDDKIEEEFQEKPSKKQPRKRQQQKKKQQNKEENDENSDFEEKPTKKQPKKRQQKPKKKPIIDSESDIEQEQISDFEQEEEEEFEVKKPKKAQTQANNKKQPKKKAKKIQSDSETDFAEEKEKDQEFSEEEQQKKTKKQQPKNKQTKKKKQVIESSENEEEQQQDSMELEQEQKTTRKSRRQQKPIKKYNLDSEDFSDFEEQDIYSDQDQEQSQQDDEDNFSESDFETSKKASKKPQKKAQKPLKKQETSSISSQKPQKQQEPKTTTTTPTAERQPKKQIVHKMLSQELILLLLQFLGEEKHHFLTFLQKNPIYITHLQSLDLFSTLNNKITSITSPEKTSYFTISAQNFQNFSYLIEQDGTLFLKTFDNDPKVLNLYHTLSLTPTENLTYFTQKILKTYLQETEKHNKKAQKSSKTKKNTEKIENLTLSLQQILQILNNLTQLGSQTTDQETLQNFYNSPILYSQKQNIFLPVSNYLSPPQNPENKAFFDLFFELQDQVWGDSVFHKNDHHEKKDKKPKKSSQNAQFSMISQLFRLEYYENDTENLQNFLEKTLNLPKITENNQISNPEFFKKLLLNFDLTVTLNKNDSEIGFNNFPYSKINAFFTKFHQIIDQSLPEKDSFDLLKNLSLFLDQNRYFMAQTLLKDSENLQENILEDHKNLSRILRLSDIELGKSTQNKQFALFTTASFAEIPDNFHNYIYKTQKYKNNEDSLPKIFQHLQTVQQIIQETQENPAEESNEIHQKITENHFQIFENTFKFLDQICSVQQIKQKTQQKLQENSLILLDSPLEAPQFSPLSHLLQQEKGKSQILQNMYPIVKTSKILQRCKNLHNLVDKISPQILLKKLEIFIKDHQEYQITQPLFDAYNACLKYLQQSGNCSQYLSNTTNNNVVLYLPCEGCIGKSVLEGFWPQNQLYLVDNEYLQEEIDYEKINIVNSQINQQFIYQLNCKKLSSFIHYEPTEEFSQILLQEEHLQQQEQELPENLQSMQDYLTNIEKESPFVYALNRLLYDAVPRYHQATSIILQQQEEQSEDQELEQEQENEEKETEKPETEENLEQNQEIPSSKQENTTENIENQEQKSPKKDENQEQNHENNENDQKMEEEEEQEQNQEEENTSAEQTEIEQEQDQEEQLSQPEQQQQIEFTQLSESQLQKLSQLRLKPIEKIPVSIHLCSQNITNPSKQIQKQHFYYKSTNTIYLQQNTNPKFLHLKLSAALKSLLQSLILPPSLSDHINENCLTMLLQYQENLQTTTDLLTEHSIIPYKIQQQQQEQDQEQPQTFENIQEKPEEFYADELEAQENLKNQNKNRKISIENLTKIDEIYDKENENPNFPSKNTQKLPEDTISFLKNQCSFSQDLINYGHQQYLHQNIIANPLFHLQNQNSQDYTENLRQFLEENQDKFQDHLLLSKKTPQIPSIPQQQKENISKPFAKFFEKSQKTNQKAAISLEEQQQQEQQGQVQIDEDEMQEILENYNEDLNQIQEIKSELQTEVKINQIKELQMLENEDPVSLQKQQELQNVSKKLQFSLESESDGKQNQNQQQQEKQDFFFSNSQQELGDDIPFNDSQSKQFLMMESDSLKKNSQLLEIDSWEQNNKTLQSLSNSEQKRKLTFQEEEEEKQQPQQQQQKQEDADIDYIQATHNTQQDEQQQYMELEECQQGQVQEQEEEEEESYLEEGQYGNNAYAEYYQEINEAHQEYYQQQQFQFQINTCSEEEINYNKAFFNYNTQTSSNPIQQQQQQPQQQQTEQSEHQYEQIDVETTQSDHSQQQIPVQQQSQQQQQQPEQEQEQQPLKKQFNPTKITLIQAKDNTITAQKAEDEELIDKRNYFEDEDEEDDNQRHEIEEISKERPNMESIVKLTEKAETAKKSINIPKRKYVVKQQPCKRYTREPVYFHLSSLQKNGVQCLFNQKQFTEQDLIQNENVEKLSLIISVLGKQVFGFNSLESLGIVMDKSNTIAFNMTQKHNIYFNVSYWENSRNVRGIDMTEQQRKIQTFSFWFTIFCHELAHNIICEHNSEHESYMQNLLIQYMPNFNCIDFSQYSLE